MRLETLCRRSGRKGSTSAAASRTVETSTEELGAALQRSGARPGSGCRHRAIPVRSASIPSSRRSRPVPGRKTRRRPMSPRCWLLADQLGLDLEADRLGQQEPARLQGGVPGQAPVLAVDLRDHPGEADALVAPGVDGPAEELQVHGDRAGGPLDGQLPLDLPFGLAVAGPDAGAAEADGGVVL